MKAKFNPRVIYTLASAIIILLGTVTAIQYAQGKYRFTQDGLSKETGLLAANSFPTGAQVYVNDRLVTATDDTLYLKPSEYTVRIQKEGYHVWQKKLRVEGTLVTQTNAQLFPVVPSLTPLTFSGSRNMSPSPDGQKLIFYTSQANVPEKNGLYILDMSNPLLVFQKEAIQITEDVANLNLASAKYIWSPDSSEILLITHDKEVLLATNKLNNLKLLPDISFKSEQILSGWEEEIYLRERQFLSKFPEAVISMATSSAKNVYLSPDKKRLLYTATANYTLPTDLIPPVLATSSQSEFRELEPGNVYVYDREEDKNFLVGGVASPSAYNKMLLATDLFNRTPLSLESSPSAFAHLQATSSAQTAIRFEAYYSPLFTHSFQWMPDSKHLVIAGDNQINIKTYDNTNETIIYSGPFADKFVYPWPDGNKLLISTAFSPGSPLNLYAIDLK